MHQINVGNVKATAPVINFVNKGVNMAGGETIVETHVVKYQVAVLHVSKIIRLNTNGEKSILTFIVKNVSLAITLIEAALHNVGNMHLTQLTVKHVVLVMIEISFANQYVHKPALNVQTETNVQNVDLNTMA